MTSSINLEGICPLLEVFDMGRSLAFYRDVLRDYGMSQLSFKDPDGYSLCLQWTAA